MWERLDLWTSVASRLISIGGILAVVASTAGGWAQGTINGYVDGRVEKRLAQEESLESGAIANVPMVRLCLTSGETKISRLDGYCAMAERIR